VTANFSDEYLANLLRPAYRIVFSDIAGNNESLAFLYHRRKLTLLEKIGEIAVYSPRTGTSSCPGFPNPSAALAATPHIATFHVGSNGTTTSPDTPTGRPARDVMHTCVMCRRVAHRAARVVEGSA
jgi:hypothetical protein